MAAPSADAADLPPTSGSEEMDTGEEQAGAPDVEVDMGEVATAQPPAAPAFAGWGSTATPQTRRPSQALAP